jgi:hypothetical protein
VRISVGGQRKGSEGSPRQRRAGPLVYGLQNHALLQCCKYSMNIIQIRTSFDAEDTNKMRALGAGGCEEGGSTP